MHPTPLPRALARIVLAASLGLGLAGALILLTGIGPLALERWGGVVARPNVWHEAVRPFLIAGTLFALTVAVTLGLGGSPARRD